MNRICLLLVFIGICLGVAVAEAQVTTPTVPGARGAGPQRGGTSDLLGLLNLLPSQNAPAARGGNGPTAWWTDNALMARLGLTDLQKLKIEGAFQAYRQSLTSAKEMLEKEEGILAKLLDSDSIDRSAVMLQVNKVIQARSEMERVNSTMTLEMREQLTRAQWAQLQGQPAGGRGGRGGAPAGPPAPDSFAARYAADKPVTLEGRVTEFRYQDPHTFIIFDVVGNDGRTTSWTGELGGSTVLARQGFTSTSLKPGDKIIIEGSHSIDPSLNAVNVRSVRRLP